MKLMGWVVGAAAIVFGAGCANAPKPLTDVERAAIADSVNQVLTQWLADFSKAPSAEKWMSAFVPGPDLVHAEYGMIYPTRDSLVTAVRAFLKTVATLNVTMNQKRLTVLDRDVVVLTTMMNGTFKDAAGKETPFNEAWMAVYHRTPDGWKIATDHESTAPPAPAPVRPSRRG